MTRKEYIARWHALFTDYVNTTLAIIAKRVNNAEKNDRNRLSYLKLLLEGPDVCDVKADLSSGVVTGSTLDKTERIYSEIDKFFVDVIFRDDRDKEGLKRLADVLECYRKEMTRLELSILK